MKKVRTKAPTNPARTLNSVLRLVMEPLGKFLVLGLSMMLLLLESLILTSLCE